MAFGSLQLHHLKILAQSHSALLSKGKKGGTKGGLKGEMVICRDGDVTFIPSAVKRGAKVEFGEFGKKGAAPLGMEHMLTATNLNHSSMWLSSKVLTRYGVICPRLKFKLDLVEYRLSCMSHMYPVNDHVRALAVAVHESKNLRGFHLLGDDDDIASIWTDLYTYEANIRQWDVAAKAMCWTAMTPGTIYIPYMDLDERGMKDDFDRVWRERVAPTIQCVNRALTSTQGGEYHAKVFFNTREAGELWKFSFHVHWPKIGVKDINNWKQFLHSLPDMPRKLEWKQHGGKWTVQENPRIPIFDPAVYGGRRQLFRGPFCGKEGNLAAAMTPCTMVEEDGKYKFSPRRYDAIEIKKNILLARIARWPSAEITLLSFSEGCIAAPSARPAHDSDDLPLLPEVVTALDTKYSKLVEFVMPFFISSILPLWQKRRCSDAALVKGRGAVVPITDLHITKSVPHRERPAVRFMSVSGDSFCYMDDDHVHRRSTTAIGLVVDFANSTIAQTCFACGPDKPGRKYSFLHANNRIEIATEEESAFTATSFWGATKNACQLLLDYFSHLFVFQRATRTLWVYDKENCVWRTELGGNMIVGRLIDELNEKHLKYLQCYKEIVIKRQIRAHERANPDITQEVAELFVATLHDGARKFMADNTPMITMGAGARAKVLEDLKSYHVHREIRDMNMFPNLIPMKNKKCIDVFTGEIADMEPRHFFTSCVNAEIIPPGDETVVIDKWFLEISTGDIPKCLYLKRFSAYCFTFLVHDRKFVLGKGNGKNAKGAWKEFIMKISEGPDGFDSRAKNLLQNYWDKRGNANTSAENATPESFELMNKTFLYTDDIMPVPLDTNKLKRMVGATKGSGRGLYGKPVDIDVKGKVVFTSNFDPDGPGEDIAYWERSVIVPFLTKYVGEGEVVDEKNYRFRQNHVAYTELLELLDGFFTVAVQALVAYYKSLPWCEEKKSPACLGAFPLPPSVIKYNKEARARALPLAAFVADYMHATAYPGNYSKVDDVFENYIIFLDNLNEQKMKKDTTQTSFAKLMAIAMNINTVNGFVEGYILHKKVTSTRKRQFEERSYGAPLAPPEVIGRAREGSILDAALARPSGAVVERDVGAMLEADLSQAVDGVLQMD